MSELKQLYNGLTVTISADGIRTIRLNRPSRKNALSMDMYSSIVDALNDAANDGATKFVVLTGTGDYFSSGNDLSNFMNTDDDGKDMDEMLQNGGQLMPRIT